MMKRKITMENPGTMITRNDSQRQCQIISYRYSSVIMVNNVWLFNTKNVHVTCQSTIAHTIPCVMVIWSQSEYRLKALNGVLDVQTHVLKTTFEHNASKYNRRPKISIRQDMMSL